MGTEPVASIPAGMERVCGRAAPPVLYPVVPGGRDEVRKVLAECLQHSPRGTITWHPLGCIGAPAFKLLGCGIPKLADWGRWWTEKQAQHDTKCAPLWSIPEFLSLPYPESFPGFSGWELGRVSVRTKDVWQEDAWTRKVGPTKLASRARNAQAGKDVGREVVELSSLLDSSSDGSKPTDDEEEEPGGPVPADQGEPASAMEEDIGDNPEPHAPHSPMQPLEKAAQRGAKARWPGVGVDGKSPETPTKKCTVERTWSKSGHMPMPPPNPRGFSGTNYF